MSSPWTGFSSEGTARAVSVGGMTAISEEVVEEVVDEGFEPGVDVVVSAFDGGAAGGMSLTMAYSS